MALTEYGCPACPKDDPGQIDYSPGQITCSKNPAHIWRDTQEFAKLLPQKRFTVAAPKFAAQQGHVKMEVMVPLGVKQKLEATWGGKLEATVAGVLAMMSEGQTMIVPNADLQRMKERLGKVPESAAELFGLIYAATLQRDEAKAEAEGLRQDVAAYEGTGKASVVVALGDQYQNALDKARGQEPPETLKQFLERNLRNALAEGWF